MLNGKLEFLADAVDPSGDRWQVMEVDAIQSCVDLEGKVARISRVRTRAQEQIHFHELGHVEWSKKLHHETDDLSFICRMLDEFRVDWKLKTEKGIEVGSRMDDFDLEAYMEKVPTTTLARAGLYLQFRYHAASVHSKEHVRETFKKIRGYLPPALTEILEAAIKTICLDTSHETMCEEARKINKYFAPPPPKPLPPMPITKEVAQEIRFQKAEEEKEAEQKAEAAKGKEKEVKPDKISTEEKEQKYKEAVEFQKKLEDTGIGSVPRFGGAIIHDHLARKQKFLQVKAPFTRTGRGLTPEFMENYCVDKRIYRTDHRGGVIVIDCSGSMRPNWNLIQGQMQEFPNLVVLSYQGITRYNALVDEKKPVNGIICVHARNGRIDPVFQREPIYAGGNDVDVEALQYGAKFKGPRIWVSDGFACGGQYDDGKWDNYETGRLPAMIRDIMRKEHYIRVNNLEDALAWVNQSRKVHYWTAGVLEPTAVETAYGRFRGQKDSTTSKHHRYERRSR